MADEIRATPRNQLLGLLADTLQGGANFASKPFGYDNPPVRGLLDLMGVPALTNTLNELSYGGALGTGSGMTYRPKADTLDAAMAVAPLMSAAPAAINRGAAVVGRAVEPVVNSMVNRTMANGGQGAQFLRDMAQGTQSNMFIGKGAKTWDALQAAKALELEKAGTSARQIWSETGTWRGPDGKWRQEIPDNKSFYVGSKAGGGSYSDDVFLHPELYKAYPNTAKSRVIESTLDGGNFDPVSRKITVGPRDAGSTMAHEQQHQIQELEGFARGGSPENFMQQKEAVLARDALSWRRELLAKKQGAPDADISALENALVQEYQELGAMDMLPSREARDLARQPSVLFPEKYADNSEFKNLTELIQTYGLDQNVTPAKDVDLYRRLAGEAEARATQARIPLNASQRRAIFPEDSYDVPVNQLIVRQDGLLGPQMAIDPKAQKQLVNGLLTQGNAERYRLGDLKPKQADALDNFGGSPTRGLLDVYISPEAETHIRQRRVIDQGMSPETVGVLSKQAMRPDSVAMPAKTADDFPTLLSQPVSDGNELYQAEMPLRAVTDGFEVVSVIPTGKRSKK